MSNDARSQFFNKLVWKEDRMLLNDFVFRLEDRKNDDIWELDQNCFRFGKTRKLIDQFRRYFHTRAEFQPRNIFELGTYDGGSTAFWFECFQPSKCVSID